MNYDALLAALVAFAFTLALFLFAPFVVAELPDTIRTAAVYLVVALIVSGISIFVRKRLRK